MEKPIRFFHLNNQTYQLKSKPENFTYLKRKKKSCLGIEKKAEIQAPHDFVGTKHDPPTRCHRPLQLVASHRLGLSPF
jgi:hypothetical protein